MQLTPQELGTRIKDIRKSKGKNQREVSDQVGINVPSYSKIESGITDVNFQRLQKIAEVLGTTIVKLIS